MIVAHLLPEQIDTYWPECSGILEKTFRDKLNMYTVDDFYSVIKLGVSQLWAVFEGKKVIGVAVTSIDEGSAARVCTVISMAGEKINLWSKQLDDAITDFAKVNKCKAIEMVTRKGMMKFFPNFEEDGVIYIRMLENL